MLRAPHILELRVAMNAYEVSFGITPTVWTEFEANKFEPRPQYINELRESVEGILTVLGIPLEDWLSWDENQDPTLGITGWLDGSRLAKNAVVRAMHIEELRKVILAPVLASWIENWVVMKDSPIYVLGDPTEYYVPFVFDILSKTVTHATTVTLDYGYSILVNREAISGTSWEGDRYSYDDTFKSYWYAASSTTWNNILDKSFQDHYISVRSIFDGSVLANAYPVFSGASFWDSGPATVSFPTIYLKQAGVEKGAIFKTLSSGSILTSMSGENPTNYRNGRIYFVVRINSDAMNNVAFYFYLGSNFSGFPTDLFSTWVNSGVTNLNSNLTSLFKTIFPVYWAGSNDVYIHDVAMGYKVGIDCPPLHSFPTPTPARTIKWDLQFTVDKIEFDQT